MIDVTDRHCRYFHRLLAPKARLYTEMITTGALKFGDQARHLDFDDQEHPVALQLGGNDPHALAQCAVVGQQWGYDEINLNCGCPSDRVQKGAFGAQLMKQPAWVADLIKAMQDAVTVPVTVKHRLGLGYEQDVSFVLDFVGALYEVGCRVFIVHARNAVLEGLSPKDNREIPPLRYAHAAAIKQHFSDATVVLNGGLHDVNGCVEALHTFDGVMLGRAAWHDPGCLAELSLALGHLPEHKPIDIQHVFEQYTLYCERQIQLGVPLRVLTRPILGWMQGTRGARQWRRTLSDPTQLGLNHISVIEQAWKVLNHPLGQL